MLVQTAMAADNSAKSAHTSGDESLSAGSREIAAPDRLTDGANQNAETEVVWEWDAYYSDVSLHIPLTNKQIPEISAINEFEIYRKLFVSSLIPNFMVLEAAVFPMPVLGVTSKKYLPGFYRSFNLGSDDVNLLEAFTAGFQEPYAFSIFFGEIISFVKPSENKVGTNKGYMGYLASYSNQHIRRNVLIPDHNVEAEWKMKGEKIFRDDKLSWSFRLGAKVHQNPDIANTFYLGIRRKNLDFKDSFFSFLANSDLDMRWDFSTKDGRPLRQQYIIGKSYPIEKWHVAFRMDVGLIWEHPDMYSGPLRDIDAHYFSAVLRPNIEF
jgi:hypothetical protein